MHRRVHSRFSRVGYRADVFTSPGGQDFRGPSEFLSQAFVLFLSFLFFQLDIVIISVFKYQYDYFYFKIA